MTYSLKSTSIVSLAVIGLVACASTPEPSPRLIATENALAGAKSNAQTMERGRASIEQADASLERAKLYYFDRDTPEFTHEIRMTEGYVALATARGDKARVETQIAAVKDEQSRIQIAAREREIASEARARQAAEQAAANARAKVTALQQELQNTQIQENELGTTLVLQDLQFANNSAQLRAGAQSRLQPLSNFLQTETDARVRVEGHTDSRGGDSFNQALSQNRAQAVVDYLTSQGIGATRFDVIGVGEARPIASNDTVSGREENRRVEVTILNK